MFTLSAPDLGEEDDEDGGEDYEGQEGEGQQNKFSLGVADCLGPLRPTHSFFSATLGYDEEEDGEDEDEEEGEGNPEKRSKRA